MSIYFFRALLILSGFWVLERAANSAILLGIQNDCSPSNTANVESRRASQFMLCGLQLGSRSALLFKILVASCLVIYVRKPKWGASLALLLQRLFFDKVHQRPCAHEEQQRVSSEPQLAHLPPFLSSAIRRLSVQTLWFFMPVL